MVTNPKVRVAIVGAAGIGKHHAKWWHLEGAHVCACVGTTEASVAAGRQGLEKLFPFTGQTYTDVPEMLAKERPDIVDVCSPPHLHYTHTRAALEAGCDVLCEKPFLYDPDVPHSTLLTQARELVQLAAQRGRRLDVCTQYAVGARIIKRLWEEAYPATPITRYIGHIESPARGREPLPRRVWVDLAPHPLSVLHALFPEFQVQWPSLVTRFDKYEARARFRLTHPAGPAVDCEILTANALPPGGNTRCFHLNDAQYTIDGENDEAGIYRARISTPTGSHIEPDMMHQLIRDFLAGAPGNQGPNMLSNLELLLRILEAASVNP